MPYTYLSFYVIHHCLIHHIRSNKKFLSLFSASPPLYNELCQ